MENNFLEQYYNLYDEDGKPKISQLFVTDKCAVSINPETGVLIQCNPK